MRVVDRASIDAFTRVENLTLDLTNPFISQSLGEGTTIVDIEQIADLLVPYLGDDLETYPVSRYVNSPRNNDERCIEPAA